MLRKIFRRRHSGVADLVLLVCLSVTFAPFLMAQTAGIGTLTGKVIDASGNAVANATVTATSVDNDQTRSATTATNGAYKFDGLPPGNYRLKFEAAGFKTLEIPSVTVMGTETAVLDEKPDAAEPTTKLMQRNRIIYRTRRPAVRQHLRFRILALLRSRLREIPRSKRCWINGHTC